MTFNQIVRNASGAKIQAVLDGAGESAEIGLYQVTPDDFAEDIVLDWPEDWPSRVSVKFLQDLGVEVIRA